MPSVSGTSNTDKGKRPRFDSFHLPKLSSDDSGASVILPEDLKSSPFRRSRNTSIAESSAHDLVPNLWHNSTLDPAEEAQMPSLQAIRISRILQTLYNVPSLLDSDDMYRTHGHVTLGEHSPLHNEMNSVSQLISSQNAKSQNSSQRNDRFFSSLRVPKKTSQTIIEEASMSDSEHESLSSVERKELLRSSLPLRLHPLLSPDSKKEEIVLEAELDEQAKRQSGARRNSETYRDLNAVSPISF